MRKTNEESSLYDIFYLAGMMIGRNAAHTGRSSPGQDRILEALSENNAINQHELLDKLNLRAGSLSELLAKIEHKGLISREKDENDKRSTVITLTEAGREEAKKAKEQRKLKQTKVFDVLTDDERRILKDILLKLTADWEEKISEAHRSHASERAYIPRGGREGFRGEQVHSDKDSAREHMGTRPYGHGGRGSRW